MLRGRRVGVLEEVEGLERRERERGMERERESSERGVEVDVSRADDGRAEPTEGEKETVLEA